MSNDQRVDDFSGVCVGRATENGEVVDHSGVRLGVLDADGYAVDDSHVRFGHTHAGRPMVGAR
jgi:hypothetical protein